MTTSTLSREAIIIRLINHLTDGDDFVDTVEGVYFPEDDLVWNFKTWEDASIELEGQKITLSDSEQKQFQNIAL